MDKNLISHNTIEKNQSSKSPVCTRKSENSRECVPACHCSQTYVNGLPQKLIKCPVCLTNIVVSITQNDLKRAEMERPDIPQLRFSREFVNGNSLSFCNTCNGNEAEVNCIECDQNLCFECARIHLKSTATVRHHITGIVSKLSSGASTPNSPKNKNHLTNGVSEGNISPRLQTLTLGSPTSPNNNRQPERRLPRPSQLAKDNVYQRGNSPRVTNEKTKFDFKTPTVIGWKKNFSLIKKFDVESYVLSICPATGDQCWIAEAMSSGIHKYNSEGEHIKSIDVFNEVRDMTINKATGDIYVSCFTAKVIKVVNQEGEIDIFAQMDMHPAGIGVTSYGDVVVCAVQDFRRRHKREHRNRLLVYSRHGILKKEIERDQNGRIFSYPEYIDININGDMCVSDIENECVTILDEDARVKCVYKGPPKGTLNQAFDPRDLKCDKDGNIIVCDINNNALHLLNVYGEYQRVLISEKDEIYWPDVVGIDQRNHIWVRELWQHSIKVYQNL
ncbi:uncharacterized protein LOC134699750 [Mytilus trossulus]|uniref:uncharacterized protein LOC134699750 n=1 Tax=Mytilus trossulus TaxID=6551 RepID=UPI00300547F9